MKIKFVTRTLAPLAILMGLKANATIALTLGSVTGAFFGLIFLLGGLTMSSVGVREIFNPPNYSLGDTPMGWKRLGGGVVASFMGAVLLDDVTQSASLQVPSQADANAMGLTAEEQESYQTDLPILNLIVHNLAEDKTLNTPDLAQRAFASEAQRLGLCANTQNAFKKVVAYITQQK